jgi:hypothetical protein
MCREDYLALGSDQGVDGDYYLVVASVITLQIIQEQLELFFQSLYRYCPMKTKYLAAECAKMLKTYILLS